ncbi:UDP-N-acetylglucosamine diphosphorylase/glucosamine-1-phosphate N-acetyltransferase [Candidatus Dependentiae bacterium]|nr:UDP-N-acetylglucosamine diphosphorylase/glucosamine-1-phosphate N-acetyltransferase [Candidatus Dependentiae bacterium]
MPLNKNTLAVVLAAGKSTRFNTKKCKLLYTVCGQPMILYPLKVLNQLKIDSTLIIGYQADKIKQTIKNARIKNVSFAIQEEQLGTGHAVRFSKNYWNKENILILNGDSPLLKKDIIQNLLNMHADKKADVTFLSAHALNPFGYGRVIKTDTKIEIVEDKDCNEDQKFTTLINAGVYLFTKKFLEKNIDLIKKSSKSGEFYITDLVNLASSQNLKVQTIPVAYDDIRGVNTLEELWAVEQVKRSELMKYWMLKGVRFDLAQSIHLDYDVEIGTGSFIGAGTLLLKGTKIGKNCNVSALSIIEDSIIGDNSNIRSHSIIQQSKIGENSIIGPFARLRKDVIIGDNVEVGNFVEIKNSKIDNGTKLKHLSYIGDSKIGKSVNIGAGTITCNYDGFEKHETTIEDGVFVGSNNTIIAPIKISSEAYTAGGSTITKDVPSKSLAIARAKQENKRDYASKIKKNNTKSKTKKTSKNQNNLTLNFIGAVKDKESERVL